MQMAESIRDQLIVEDDQPGRVSSILHNIEYLHGIDNRTIPCFLSLLADGHEDTFLYLRMYLNDEPDMPAITESTNAFIQALGPSYTVASMLMEHAARVNSIAGLDLPAVSDGKRLRMKMLSSSGDRSITLAKLALRPNVIEVSSEQRDRYYHPLAVASLLLNAHLDRQPFLDAAPAFMEWAAAHEHMPAMLATAMAISSLDPTTIEDFTIMHGETMTALHGGLI